MKLFWTALESDGVLHVEYMYLVNLNYIPLNLTQLIFWEKNWF